MNQFAISFLLVLFVVLKCMSSAYYMQTENQKQNWKKSNQGVDSTSSDLQSDKLSEIDMKKLLVDMILEDLLNEEMEKMDKKKKEEETIEVEALNEVSLLDSDLTEDEKLEALELALIEDAQDSNDGIWLDKPLDLDLLPPNYHNSTEVKTKVGGQNVDVKETIDKTTYDSGKSTSYSEVLEATNVKNSSNYACSLSQPCANDQYCAETEYSSQCLTCLPYGYACTTHEKCCDIVGQKIYCTRGWCTFTYKTGTIGSTCESVDDCHPGLCCAHVPNYPEKQCQLYSGLYEKCSPVNTDSEQSNTFLKKSSNYCPCQSGLSCELRLNRYYKLLQIEPSHSHICIRKAKKPTDYGTFENNPISEDGLPISDENLVDIYNKLLQERAESVDDQLYLNPESFLPHHNMKESVGQDA